jgi:hypothetical protein
MDHTQRDHVGPRSLQLTKLGYGGAPIGNFSTSVTDADAHGAMQAAWQAGIRYFDTAPWYGLGLSRCTRKFVGGYVSPRTRPGRIAHARLECPVSPAITRNGWRRRRRKICVHPHTVSAAGEVTRACGW